MRRSGTSRITDASADRPPAAPWGALASRTCWTRGVRVQPGHTVFTSTLSAATSFARVFAQPRTASLMLFDNSRLSMGCFTEVEETFTMRPHRRARIPGSTARAMRTADMRVSSTALAQPASSMLLLFPGGGPPTLLTSTSTGPRFDVTCCANASAADGCDRSAAIARTPDFPCGSSCLRAASSRSAPRAQMATRAPSCTNTCAAARPMPLLAPVTRTERFASPRSMSPPPMGRPRSRVPPGFSARRQHLEQKAADVGDFLGTHRMCHRILAPVHLISMPRQRIA